MRGTVMTKRNCLVFFLITALIFTMCSFSVFATDGEAAPDSTEQVGDTAADTAADDATADDTIADDTASDTAADDAVSSDDTVADDSAKDDTATEDDASDADDTTATGTTDDATTSEDATEEEHDHEHEEETTNKKNGLSTTAIVLLAVFGAIILIFAVLYAFKPSFRERVKKFFREYKSELKKVVWSSKADVLKNTKIVIIGIVAIAVVVGLVDIGLAKLIDLIGQIGK